MTRLFCIGIVVAAVLFAMPAFASVPFPGNCTIEWYQPVEDDTLILVCPQGDGTKLDVTVLDQFSLPIALQTVTATFADTRVCADPISGITDANGYVRLTIQAGANASAGMQPRVSSDYSVVCMGMTLKTATVSIMSPDYNCASVVDGLDYSFFSLDWLKNGGSIRSDFNDDKTVDGLDYSIFALHWLHQ